MDVQEQLQLVIEWNDQQWRLRGGDVELAFGSQDDQDIVVRRAYASREHAHIRLDGGTYVFIDHSTNGSFVRSEDQQVTFVHRDSMRLWGRGLISFGEPPSADSVVCFQLG
jgi:pSer/pThr/pTyr-binding forkhead associated (FHA) protein